MERIAIISDVHGNKTALETVLSDIHSRNISRIFCLGDSVTKCANPDIVIDLLKANCEVILKGNCDDIMSSSIAYEKNFWTRIKIGEDRADFLRNLPIIYEFYLSGYFIRLFHASPFGLSHIYNPMFSNEGTNYSLHELSNPLSLFTNASFINKTKDDKIPDIVGYGHIHTQNLLRVGNKTIFNPGSVGMPIEMKNINNNFDKTNCFSTLASYTILEGNWNSKDLSSICFNSVRLPYNINKEISYLEQSDMPGKEKIIYGLKTASPNT